MTSFSSAFTARRFDHTIRTLCPLIESEVSKHATRCIREYELRRELVSCILGSQVRYEMAVEAIENLESAGLLNDAYWCQRKDDEFEGDVFMVLAGRSDDPRHGGSYRFPGVRAKQLAQVRSALARAPIMSRLTVSSCSSHLRQQLIEDISGIGPKQASMFLRNIGKSYDLAILDTHVLQFMRMQGLLSEAGGRIGTIKEYEKTERVVVQYAASIGYPVGYLDWAIWATMKAARELGV